MSTEQRVDGPTPNGGAYAVAYFQDAKGNPVAKSKAVQVRIVEYDANDAPVFRTYGRINKPVIKGVTIDEEAHEAATSPFNDKTPPTPAQQEAGNYAKGHIRFDNGWELAIENTAGSHRRPEWPVLRSHYGYAKRTEGADGDELDVFVRPGITETYDGPVWVVNQFISGSFDEHKSLVGWFTEQGARAAYLENYTPDWKGLESIVELTMDQAKAWSLGGDLTKPLTAEVVADYPEHTKTSIVSKAFVAPTSATSGISAYSLERPARVVDPTTVKSKARLRAKRRVRVKARKTLH